MALLFAICGLFAFATAFDAVAKEPKPRIAETGGVDGQDGPVVRSDYDPNDCYNLLIQDQCWNTFRYCTYPTYWSFNSCLEFGLTYYRGPGNLGVGNDAPTDDSNFRWCLYTCSGSVAADDGEETAKVVHLLAEPPRMRTDANEEEKKTPADQVIKSDVDADYDANDCWRLITQNTCPDYRYCTYPTYWSFTSCQDFANAYYNGPGYLTVANDAPTDDPDFRWCLFQCAGSVTAHHGQESVKAAHVLVAEEGESSTGAAVWLWMIGGVVMGCMGIHIASKCRESQRTNRYQKINDFDESA